MYYRTWGYWSPALQPNSLPSLALSNWVNSSPTLGPIAESITTKLSNVRRHHFGGGGARQSGGFRNVLFLLILIAIVPLIILVLTGPNTNNPGIYGNTTVSNSMRNSAVTFASFFVVFVILIVVKGLEFLGI